MTVDNKLYYAVKLLSSVGIYHIWSQICVAYDVSVIETEINGEFWIINPVDSTAKSGIEILVFQ